MAKNNKEQLPDVPETMEDYMLQQLKKTVILKDGNTLKDPHLSDILSPLWQGGGYKAGVEIRLAA